ncbi:MAG: peptidase MA family metallohydrolase [Candidatus Omnitrophota bacterium]
MNIKVLIISAAIFFGFSAAAFSDNNWQEYRCQHFIIYYKDVPQDFLKSVEEMAEYYYQEITKNLGFIRYENWSWDKRAKIYIYNDAQNYIDEGRQAGWSHGSASFSEKIIRTFPTAAGFFDSTLPHELGHIIFREFVGFKADVPLWMDEGIAMYQEKAKRWGVNDFVRKAIEEKRFVSLKELSEMQLNSNTDRDTIDLFYAESASVVYYLITEAGEYKFVNFCRALKEGRRFNDALRSVYMRFKDLEELNKAWVTYLNN